MESESYGFRCYGRIGLDVSGNWRMVELRTNLLDGIGDMGGGSRTCASPAACVHKQWSPGDRFTLNFLPEVFNATYSTLNRIYMSGPVSDCNRS